MKRILFILILLAFTTRLPAQERWTLEECIRYGMEHNLDLQAQDIEIAARKGIHDWEVIKHSVLAEIARKMPLSQKELMDVRGVGIATWNRYGEDILTVVQGALFSSEGQAPVNAHDEITGAGPLKEPCPAPL